jgi:GTPase SAR1 family protein
MRTLTERQSFELCRIIHDKILNITGLDWVPVVLVANKCDLLGQRQVKEQEGLDLAAEWKVSTAVGATWESQHLFEESNNLRPDSLQSKQRA